MSIFPTTLIVSPAPDIPCQRLVRLLPGFTGSPVMFPLRYTPPYENFNSIRRIQLLMQRTAAQEVQPALIVDVSEWLDHTSEEYFDITLRFLADHPGCHPMFLTEKTSEKRMKAMSDAIDLYFRCEITEDRCFDLSSEMRRYLSDSFDISPADAAETAKFLINSDFPCRYGLIERFLSELKSRAGDGQITGQLLRKLKENGSMPLQFLTEAARAG